MVATGQLKCCMLPALQSPGTPTGSHISLSVPFAFPSLPPAPIPKGADSSCWAQKDLPRE